MSSRFPGAHAVSLSRVPPTPTAREVIFSNYLAARFYHVPTHRLFGPQCDPPHRRLAEGAPAGRLSERGRAGLSRRLAGEERRPEKGSRLSRQKDAGSAKRGAGRARAAATRRGAGGAGRLPQAQILAVLGWRAPGSGLCPAHGEVPMPTRDCLTFQTLTCFSALTMNTGLRRSLSYRSLGARGEEARRPRFHSVGEGALLHSQGRSLG